ncbi:hypothetical protein M2277_004953 [Paenibacillus sp. LBL]|uniref:hypothetical protein n=1 Tax=Paenibacillus sp. LBL TaxID=2940563 RepID=UPI0024755109|nr:hypothetical protein [Paenibacillus sp. LBL]MDH6674261.1 hypothetical protein [Paenibacillus sp. LBL]
MKYNIPEKYTGYKPFPDEPDEKEFEITGTSLMRTMKHNKTRIDNKWRKRYGYERQEVSLHGLIVRSPDFGNLNGYVGVPRGNVFHGKEIPYLLTGSQSLYFLNVHGGVTFSGSGGEHRQLNHFKLMKPDLWYIGFDTAHANDLTPRVYQDLKEMGRDPSFMGTYKDIDYVERQVRRLATQIISDKNFNEVEYEENDYSMFDIFQVIGKL